MFQSKFVAIIFGFVVFISKGLNATSSNSTIQPVPSTTTMLKQSSSAQPTISPTPSTVVPQATQTVTTLPSVPTVPKRSTQPPIPTQPPLPSSPSKRTYGFIVTLENLPWNDEYNTIIFNFMKTYGPFLEEMIALFNNGSFPELKGLESTKLRNNDAGKLRTEFKAMFDAVPSQGSKEPEMYFRLKNFEKGSKYKYYVVPSSITVQENVTGVVLGNWTLEGEIPESCCGESVYQTRTCGSGSCGGLHLNRTFPCHTIYPVKCGKERKFTFNMTLGDVWKDGYKDSSSSEFIKLTTKLATGDESLLEEVRNIFKNSSTGYKEVDTNSFKISQDNGKVRVSFTVLFNEPPSKPEDPEALFRFKTENGKIGNFEIDTKSIKIEESISGFTFTSWTNKASECDKCCGGQIQQTRTCQSKMGYCPNAQLTRSIRCKHVCKEVKCGDSSMTVPYVFGILICILASSFFW